MPTTVNYQIEYPAGSAAPNVPLAMQTQAESVDEAITNLKSHAAVIGTASQSIANATWTKVTFASSEHTASGVTVNNASGTLTTTKAGLYAVSFTAGTAATTTGSFGIRVDAGATTLATDLGASGAAGSSKAMSTFVYANPTVAFTFWIYQSSGAARTTTSVRAQIVRVSDL